MSTSQPFIAPSNSLHLSLAPKPYCRARPRFSSQSITPAFHRLTRSQSSNLSGRRSTSSTRLNATGFSAIEPDLPEEKRDQWATNSISDDEFIYGEYDGHHTYHEGEEQKGSFWETLTKEYNSMEPPTGFQGIISWLFLPVIFAGLYYHVPGEYLYIGAAVFVVVFCAIEMGKPSEPHNFEPQIYNMDREARDKLIADYNSMDIWDFNEKYGELWDFTVENNKNVR